MPAPLLVCRAERRLGEVMAEQQVVSQCEFCKRAFFTISATVSQLIPRRLQYGEAIQSASDRAPLLELHERQQSAMFSRVMILASLTMCSQLGRLPWPCTESNTTPQ